MKIPYSFVQKCNELNVDISTCSLTAYHSHSLLEKNIFFDNSLTIKLKNPIKLNSLNLENINLSAGAYRLIIKDQNNKTLLDEFNVLGISSGGDVNPAFDAIKNSSGVTQFNATTLNKSISFAASGTVSLSFDDISNKITIIGQTGTYSAGAAIKITTGVISVGNIVNGGLLIGAGVNNDTNILVPGIRYNSLVIGENGLPSWGTINLTSNSAVSGILSISNGGTGLASLGTLGISILSYSSPSSGLVSWNGSSFSINTNNYLIANQSITLSGDVSGSGATAITVSVNKILGNAIPTNATGVLFNNGSGVLSWVPISGGGGTVTSVALSAPSLFTVTGSPIITSGTLGFTWNGASTNFVLADGSTVLRSNYLLSSAISGVVGQVGVFNDTNSISSSNGLTYQFNELGVAGRIVIKDIAGTSSIQLYNTSLKGYELYYYGKGLNLNEYDTSGTLISSVISIVKGSTGGITIGGISTRPVSITSLTSAAVVKSSSGGTLSNVSGPASNLVLVDGNTIPQSTFITGGPYLPISGGTETGMVTFASGTTSLAPISFQAGSLLTTPVAHHVEWNGSNLYITNSTPTRKQIAYTDSTMTGLWNGIVISPVYGGTGFSTYSIGDILYANTTSSLAKLAAASTGNVLLSGTSPSWGKVGLATHISGVLPIANGGTGISSLGTLGTAILQYSSPTSGFVKWSGTSYTIDANSYLTSNQTITLSGDVTGSGVTAISTSILSTVVTGKVLTGYSTGINSTITATDSILGAFGKVQGQINSISTSLGGGPFLPLTAGTTKALTGTLYGSNLNFTSTTDSPILITHNLAGGFTHPLQAFNSGMVAGNQYNFDFGQAASNYNAGNFGFKYVGAGSSANYVTLGLYGANDLLKITGAGVATFSGLGTGVVVGTSGTLSTLTGTNLVRGNGTLTSFVDDGPWLPLAGGVITGPITGTTTTATPFIHITSTFGNLTNAAIRATSTASGGSSIHGIATGTSGVGVWGVSSNTGGDAGLFSGQGGSNGVRAIASGGGKAGLFQGDVLVSGELKISTSLTGVLKATAGVVAVAASADLPGGPYLPLTGGNLTGDLGIINGTLRANSTYTNQGSLYGSAVASPSATNYSVLWVNDGAGTAINGSSSSYMNVAGNTKVWAYASGVTLSNTLTLSGYPTAGFVKTNGSGVVSIDTTSYLPLTGGNLNSGAQLKSHVNIVPSESNNGNYIMSPLVVNRVSSSSTDYTNVAAIGFHNCGLNAAALYYEATAGTPSFKYNRHDGGIVKIWDSSNFNPGSYLPLSGGTMSGNILASGYNLWGAARPGDGGRWTHHLPTGSLAGINTGTSNALINRYSYAGFTGFVTNNADFYGITLDHQYGGTGAQLAIVAGANGGHISFFAGNPTLQGNGYYQSPLVGDWNANGLNIVGSVTPWGGCVFPGYGDSGIYNGNGDNASYSAYNLKIRSWWGIGFESYDNVTRTVLDTRTGNFSTLGAIASGSTLSWGGGSLRDYTGGAATALYGSGVGTPGSANYSLVIGKDGSEIYMRGSNNANLVVGSTIIAQATSTGLSITGRLSSTGRLNTPTVQNEVEVVPSGSSYTVTGTKYWIMAPASGTLTTLKLPNYGGGFAPANGDAYCIIVRSYNSSGNLMGNIANLAPSGFDGMQSSYNASGNKSIPNAGGLYYWVMYMNGVWYVHGTTEIIY